MRKRLRKKLCQKTNRMLCEMAGVKEEAVSVFVWSKPRRRFDPVIAMNEMWNRRVVELLTKIREYDKEQMSEAAKSQYKFVGGPADRMLVKVEDDIEEVSYETPTDDVSIFNNPGESPARVRHVSYRYIKQRFVSSRGNPFTAFVLDGHILTEDNLRWLG